jgi:hypothetical protein
MIASGKLAQVKNAWARVCAPGVLILEAQKGASDQSILLTHQLIVLDSNNTFAKRCHAEQSEASRTQKTRFFASLRMTLAKILFKFQMEENQNENAFDRFARGVREFAGAFNLGSVRTRTATDAGARAHAGARRVTRTQSSHSWFYRAARSR